MSGPKLVGITCDEEVIRRNQERLRQIGKKAYYTDMFINMNIDVENSKKWILDYASDTIGKVTDDDVEVQKMLHQINSVKAQYVEILERNKLNLFYIEQETAEGLNEIVCKLVRNIPTWKEECIDSISRILTELQPLYEVVQKKKERNASRKKRAQEAENMQNLAQERSRITGSDKFGKISLTGNQQKEEAVVEEEKEYTLSELAFIENVKGELENFKKQTIFGEEEKKLIEDISYYFPLLEMGNDSYSMNGKRNILETVKFNYYVLTKKAAEIQARIETEQEQRRSYEIEYLTFCDALAREKKDMTHMSLDELVHQVEVMRKSVEQQEQRIYIEDAVGDIMKKYGYRSISAVHLHEADQVSRIIFSDAEDKKICASFGNGTVMMQVVGEGEKAPVGQEVQALVEQQGAFCNLYPDIKKELEERQIHIVSENCAPVSAESAINIKISRQKNIKQNTKRHSVLKHVRYGQNSSRYGSQEKVYADEQQKNMYVDG